MLFTPNCSVKCREYVCDCEYILCDDEGDEDIDQNQQIFDFVDVALCMSLFTGNPAKPLCFVKVTEKRTAIKDIKDTCSHFIHTSELFFEENYLKLPR